MSALLTVWWKELRELARDRRTLMLALLFGPLLTPALILGMGRLAESRARTQIEKPLHVVMVGADRAPSLVAWLATQGITRKPFTTGDPDAAVRRQDEDLYLWVSPGFDRDWTAGRPAALELRYDSTRRDADIPVRRVERALQAYAQQVGALRLLARGISPTVALPLGVGKRDLSTPEARRGLAVAFLPYLLILSAFLGGAHLIIDATAGERERQSLEPLLATPASRAAIVSGKLAAACSLGLTALLLTLLAFKGGALLSPGIGRQMDVSFAAIARMLVILLPMVVLGTALLTWISAGAKSVKEAQSWMTLLLLLPMLPTIVLMVSPVKNQLWMFAVPFLAQNQMLLSVLRSEAVPAATWAVYLVASIGLGALLWWGAVQRYHQERLAISS
jgi:sodium transport system permease protein